MAIVFVSVLDLNDNAPEFVQNSYTATLPENSLPGTLNLLVAATDPDSGSNGRVQYSLLETYSSLFIDESTGVLSNLQPFDYETVRQLQLTVVARDMGSPALMDSVNVTINITDLNDNAPLLSVTPIAVNISESADVGTFVAVASAMDRDSPAVNGELVFSLSSNIPEFAINSSSGEITIATTLDFEAVQSYEGIMVHDTNTQEEKKSKQMNAYFVHTAVTNCSLLTCIYCSWSVAISYSISAVHTNSERSRRKGLADMLAELGGLVPRCGPPGWIVGQAREGAPLGIAYTCTATAASKHNTATIFILMLHGKIAEQNKRFSRGV